MRLKPSVNLFFVLLLTSIAGCGGNSNPSDVNSDVILTPSEVEGEGSPEDNLPINLQISEGDSSASGLRMTDTPSAKLPAPEAHQPLAEADRRNDDYSGKIVIKFKDGTDVRLRPDDRDGPPPEADSPLAKFVSLSGADVSGVNELLEARLQSGESLDAPLQRGDDSPTEVGRPESVVQSITRVMTASEEEIDRWLSYWRRQGVTLHDWNLYYYIEVPEYEDAKELVRELNRRDVILSERSEAKDLQNTVDTGDSSALRPQNDMRLGNIIDYAEILPVFYLTSVETPDMSDEQGYLKSASTGGLGVEDAWAKLDAQFPDIKLRGQHTMVVDQEYDWNFDHEILPIDETEEYLLIPSFPSWMTWGSENGKNVPANIHHGTAVVGIIAGQGNEIEKAIKGIAPNTTARIASIAGVGVLGGSSTGTSYGEGELPAGSILTIEVQQKGITTTASGCSVGDGISSPTVTGCVPIESHKFIHEGIVDSSAIGNIVIEGAGNGSVNLNDNDLAAPVEGMGAFSYFSDPANDSGAIMVGASLGASKKKAAWSNCGSRVDVFGWGAGVVTAGYGDKYNPDGADPNVIGPNGADNPKLYTGQFGGTSAATAQIAGIAAMIQSYVRQLAAEAGKVNPKQIYLDSKQIRTILKHSGQSAVYGQTPNDPNPNCNIGIQPDLALAIDRTNEFLNGTGIFADGQIYEKEGVDNKIKIVPLNSGTGLDGKKVMGPHGINYDMDGDKRAELISFSRDHKWYIDLSSVSCTSGATCGDDGYGEWDLVLNPSLITQNPSPSMLFPVVHDYNSDGKADLALYDSINGKWYIKYTTLSLINTPSPPVGEGGGEGEGALEWDRIIDYTADPAWKAYSRPVPGDYDGDNWLDPALQSPDGHWLIDYGGIDSVFIDIYEGFKYTDHFGGIDKDVKYLTDEQLAQAPGWAWLPIQFTASSDGDMWVSVKAPDNIVNGSNELANFFSPDFNKIYPDVFPDNGYYDNDVIFVSADYMNNGYFWFGLKNTDGQWDVIDTNDYSNIVELNPNDIFGDINCRPVPADYDGDDLDDRAVQCGTLWKIVFSGNNSTHEIELDSALDPLPAYVYGGGIKYKDTMALYDYYKYQINCPSDKGNNCDIFDAPPPIGPYFAQCVKYWAPNASYCWDK